MNAINPNSFERKRACVQEPEIKWHVAVIKKYRNSGVAVNGGHMDDVRCEETAVLMEHMQSGTFGLFLRSVWPGRIFFCCVYPWNFFALLNHTIYLMPVKWPSVLYFK